MKTSRLAIIPNTILATLVWNEHRSAYNPQKWQTTKRKQWWKAPFNTITHYKRLFNISSSCLVRYVLEDILIIIIIIIIINHYRHHALQVYYWTVDFALFFSRLHQQNFNLISPFCVGFFLLRLLLYGSQSVILLVYLLSFILTTCHAHLQLCSSTTSISFLYFFSNIALSMALCAILGRFSLCFAHIQVSHLYVMVGIMHWLYTFRIRHIGILLLSMSRFLMYYSLNVFLTIDFDFHTRAHCTILS